MTSQLCIQTDNEIQYSVLIFFLVHSYISLTWLIFILKKTVLLHIFCLKPEFCGELFGRKLQPCDAPSRFTHIINSLLLLYYWSCPHSDECNCVFPHPEELNCNSVVKNWINFIFIFHLIWNIPIEIQHFFSRGVLVA